MHVALFTDLHLATLGGAQIAVAAQRRALEQLGHRVTVFTPPNGKTTERDPAVVELNPVPVMDRLARVLGGYDDFVFVWPSRANAALIDDAFQEREPVDIVHVQGDLGVAVAGVEAARRHGIPVVQTKHSRYDAYFEQATGTPLLLSWVVGRMQKQDPVDQFVFVGERESMSSRLAWRFMARHAESVDHVIMPTKHFADALSRRGVTSPISVISNGIEDDVIDRVMTAKYAGSTDDDPLKLIWCGRLSAEKRPLEAIEAVARVDHCSLDIYGEGPLEESIRRVIASGGWGHRIRLHGPVDHEECLRVMRTNDVLLFTSYGFDTQGLVLLEAAAMSLPVIYCDPALGESVPAGGGVLAADSSPSSIAEAVRTVARNRDMHRAMVETLCARTDIPLQSRETAKIVEIYQSLLDRVRT